MSIPSLRSVRLTCVCVCVSVLELLHWRDVRASGLVLGCSLFLLLSLLSCSIISVLSYSSLGLLSLTLSFRTYRGVLQAIQKSDEGHPFKRYLAQDVFLSKDVVQRHSDMVLSRINGALKELRRLFLVEDLIDSTGLSIVHLKIINLSSFTSPRVISNICGFLFFSGIKRRYFKDCCSLNYIRPLILCFFY
uniref:Reticulon n=1 Tax=Cyprinus carpio TaxID=7962 RepID=A0A8C1M5X7_CYPCA